MAAVRQELHSAHLFRFPEPALNNGSDNGQITVDDALPANIEGAGWTVQDSAGTQSDSGSTTPVNLLSGASAVITVSGTVSPGSTPGNANHVITAAPGAAYVFATPNAMARINVALNIGQGGSSVSLVRAGGAAATGDAAAVAPFPGASVVNTGADSGTSANVLTAAIDPSAGQLSATEGHTTPRVERCRPPARPVNSRRYYEASCSRQLRTLPLPAARHLSR